MPATRYDLNPNVQKALEFMKTTDLNQLPAGKHVIGEGRIHKAIFKARVLY